MKKVIFALAMFLFLNVSYAQQQEPQGNAQEEGANEAEANSEEQKVLEKDQGPVDEDSNYQGTFDGDNIEDASDDDANSPAGANVGITRTTSSSGSPALLSEDNGRKPDGTNTVQRASPNIAGAEVPGDRGNTPVEKADQKIKNRNDRRTMDGDPVQPDPDPNEKEEKENKKKGKKKKDKD